MHKLIFCYLLIVMCFNSFCMMTSKELAIYTIDLYKDSDMRNERSKIQVYKDNIKAWVFKNRNIPENEYVCSLSVYVKKIEPDVKSWPEKLIADTLGEHFAPILVALSLFGYKDAINAMEELFYNKNTLFSRSYSTDVLLNSPVAWYPLCSNILNDTRHLYRGMRFKLYNFGFYKILDLHPDPGTKDSIVLLICNSLIKEPNIELLLKGDNLLIGLSGDDYRYSQERINFLNKKVNSAEIKNYIEQYGFLTIKYHEALKIITETPKERELHNANYFGKCFQDAMK